MIGILDFLINIEYIHLIILSVQLFKKDSLTSITFLFFILISIGFIILVIFSIIKIIYYLILKKKIKCMDIIESLIMPSILMSLGIIILTTIFTITIIKNEEVKIIEPNRNKYFIVLVGEKEKFKNFPRRCYISLTKECALKKIGLDKYIDIKKTLNFDNYELNEIIEKVDTIINIDNNFNLSLDEKKYLKDKIISSKGYKEIGEIRNEIYELIKEKNKNESIRKEKINLEEQKEILNNFKNTEV